MSDFNKETVDNITKLCRIACTDEEKGILLQDLDRILTYVEQLGEVNTEDVFPCSHVIPDVCNVMAEDHPENTLDHETFLSNAPNKEARVAGMIKVPTILDNE